MSRLTLRVRSARGVQRIEVDSNGRVSDLRDAIAKTCGVPIDDQLLSRRDWWATAGSSTPTTSSSFGSSDRQFNDIDLTLSSLSLKQGDMLFLSSTNVSIDNESTRPLTSMGIGTMPAPVLLRTSSIGSDTDSSRPTTSSTNPSPPRTADGFEKLVFAGLSIAADDDDSGDAHVVLLHTLQQAARDISSFVAIRPPTLTTVPPTPTLPLTSTETDECHRLLRRVHERLEVLSQSLLNLPIATGSSLGIDVSRNVARSVRYAIDPLPSLTIDANGSTTDDDDLRPITSMGLRPSTPSSAASSPPFTSASTTSSSSTKSSDAKDSRYWEERYLALRVKALKMNNAGMRLKAISEQNQSRFEQELQRRDRTIEHLQQTLREMQSSNGTYQTLSVDPAAAIGTNIPTTSSSSSATSVAAPGGLPSPSPSPPSSVRRQRPPSATRRHRPISPTNATSVSTMNNSNGPTPAFSYTPPATATSDASTAGYAHQHYQQSSPTVRRVIRPQSASRRSSSSPASSASSSSIPNSSTATATNAVSSCRVGGRSTPPMTADDFVAPSTIPLAAAAPAAATSSNTNHVGGHNDTSSRQTRRRSNDAHNGNNHNGHFVNNMNAASAPPR